MSQSIQPLRIQKGTPGASTAKMTGGPLAELSPMERRRNSPSFNQNNKKQLLDSSPFDSSPFAAKFNGSSFGSNSPRAYWQDRTPASPSRFSIDKRNPRDSSPSPAKRSSIENLKRASRVKNSTMFAREQKLEYDPASAPIVERPLAVGRPLSEQNVTPPTPTQSAFVSKDPTGAVESEQAKFMPASPSKSSLSKSSRYGQKFDPDNGTWSEEEEPIADRQLPAGKSLHRHAKSVTFDVAPPQVNEYEMTTPDPSSVASGSRDGSYDSAEDEDESFDRGSSLDRDDSFDASLEDTLKTPVVLPEDWRFMSPDAADYSLAAKMDDPFEERDGSPPPTALPSITEGRDSPIRTDSVNSNGERRPLPPLPPNDAGAPAATELQNGLGLQAAAERANATQRNLPSPPRPASVTKAELQNMSGSSMALEDRLRLMMIQEGDRASASKLAAEEQRERRLRRGAGSPDRSLERPGTADTLKADEQNEIPDIDKTIKAPPRISRESILRKVKSKTLRDSFECSSPLRSPSPEEPFEDAFDPDTPLPSLEEHASSKAPAADRSPVVKYEDEGTSEIDLYAIPDISKTQISPDLPTTAGQQDRDEDEESHYSTDMNGAPLNQAPVSQPKNELPSSLVAGNGKQSSAEELKKNHRLSFAQFNTGIGGDDFGASFSTYMTANNEPFTPQSFASPAAAHVSEAQQLKTPKDSTHLYDGSGYGDDDEFDRSSTPDSVIRRSLSEYSDPEPLPEPAPIPEPVATIKAPGGKLKTRASLAPTDFKSMAETRRQVSGESRTGMPPIPERSHKRPSVIPEADSFMPDSSFGVPDSPEHEKTDKRRSSLVQLDITMEEPDEGLSMGIDKEFDRLVEARKVTFDAFLSAFHDEHRPSATAPDSDAQLQAKNDGFANLTFRKQNGYLMRQNTKVVVASSASHDSAEGPMRGTRSAGNSPVKRNNSNAWTTEPWNGKIRRKSIRQSAGSPMKRPNAGPAPPLPGQSSNVTTGADAHNEAEASAEFDEFDEGGERGRLFVKVVGVKDLEMQLPRDERSYFALTLDNGLHCVTTAWLELGKTAPIGQEFELVVLDELEFQLTLNTKLEPPKQTKVAPSPQKKASKPLNLSRVLMSPRKRKEIEMREKEEAQKAARQRELEARAKKANPSAWDLMHKLVGADGSFARSYISLKEHENEAYGRPYTVDVPCFNEWTIDEARSVNSARSGRGAAPAAGIQRKAPYKIAKLELQLLYVPKPKDATDENMPKSMNGCIRELAEAEKTSKTSFEGFLSQQGGDCPYWRRRLFKLEGPKLTAYHEATHQPRATINLAKASKLIDDKSVLTEREVKGKGGSRRKSGFAEEEEGYMFVEEGFRVRFSNGEVIDFYADSTAEKETWMKELAKVVGKDNNSSKSWTDIVLKRERVLASKAVKAGPNTIGRKSAPNTPAAKRNAPERPLSCVSRPNFTRPHSQQMLARPSSQQSPVRPHSQQQVSRGATNKPLPPTGAARDPRRMSQTDRRVKTRSMIF